MRDFWEREDGEKIHDFGWVQMIRAVHLLPLFRHARLAARQRRMLAGNHHAHRQEQTGRAGRIEGQQLQKMEAAGNGTDEGKIEAGVYLGCEEHCDAGRVERVRVK